MSCPGASSAWGSSSWAASCTSAIGSPCCCATAESRENARRPKWHGWPMGWSGPTNTWPRSPSCSSPSGGGRTARGRRGNGPARPDRRRERPRPLRQRSLLDAAEPLSTNASTGGTHHQPVRAEPAPGSLVGDPNPGLHAEMQPLIGAGRVLQPKTRRHLGEAGLTEGDEVLRGQYRGHGGVPQEAPGLTHRADDELAIALHAEDQEPGTLEPLEDRLDSGEPPLALDRLLG